jgi:hypothetical protein
MTPLGKVLCLCEGGNVRSVALAAELKACGQDAMAAGLRRNSSETLDLLFGWADTIVVMSSELKAQWGTRYDLRQAIVVEVGRDVYGRANHPDLKAVVKKQVAIWAGQGWCR